MTINLFQMGFNEVEAVVQAGGDNVVQSLLREARSRYGPDFNILGFFKWYLQSQSNVICNIC